MNTLVNESQTSASVSEKKRSPFLKVKKTVLALSIGILCASTSFKSGASGFPTVDIAQVMQNIMEYTQLLEEYSTQLEQQAIQVSQLTQAINQYQQMLTDYDHYLTMVRGLKDYVDTASLKSILKSAVEDPTMNPFSADFDPNIYTSTGIVSINNELKRLYARSRQLSNLDTDISAFGGSSGFTDRSHGAYERSQLAALQANKNKIYTTEINDNVKASAELSDAVDMVQDTPESQVATLQLMASQNQAIQSNLQTIAKIANDQLNYSNQLPNAAFGKLAQSESSEIARLRVAYENPPTPTAENFNTF